MTDFQNAAGYALKHWSVKLYGEKPTPELLKLACYFAKGKPGNNTLCLAMAFRPEGVTSPQMVSAVGDVKHNHRRDQINAGLIAYDPDPPAKNNQHKLVYHIALTARGERYIAKADERVAKAAQKAADKANGKAVVTTAKRKKPTSEPANGVQVPAVTEAAIEAFTKAVDAADPALQA